MSNPPMFGINRQEFPPFGFKLQEPEKNLKPAPALYKA